MKNNIILLHMSDLHFGEKSRFFGVDPIILCKNFKKSVSEKLELEGGKNQIDLIMTTGDIAETARSEEYEEAAKFFNSFAQEFNISKDKFIFLPGNHDVSWFACEHEVINQKKDRFNDAELRKRMNKTKFNDFYNFVDGFYGYERKDLRLSYGAFIYDNDEINISLATINSCEEESHLPKDHHGTISDEQAQEVMNKWHNGDKYKNKIKILAVHHPMDNPPEAVRSWIEYIEKSGEIGEDLLARFKADSEGCTGWNHLKSISEDCEVSLILHGHIHSAGKWMFPWDKKSGFTQVLSAGSLGLAPDKLPCDQPNAIQLIIIDLAGDKIISWNLTYLPNERSEGSISQGIFKSSETPYSNKICLPEYLKEEIRLEESGVISATRSLPEKLDSFKHIHNNFEIQICTTSEDMIDVAAVMQHIKEAAFYGKESHLPDRHFKAILKDLGLCRNGSLTNACFLLFGKNPQILFPQSKIKCGLFGDTISNAIDEGIIKGNLFNQLFGAEQFILRNIKKGWIIEGFKRREQWEYPTEAIREVLVNAIVHRDYNENGDIQIRIFNNRIEIWSPGSLPSPLTLSDILQPHQSHPRNKLIAECFHQRGLVEEWGSGIERMTGKLEENGLPKPEFLEKTKSFVVIFKNFKSLPNQMETYIPMDDFHYQYSDTRAMVPRLIKEEKE